MSMEISVIVPVGQLRNWVSNSRKTWWKLQNVHF